LPQPIFLFARRSSRRLTALIATARGDALQIATRTLRKSSMAGLFPAGLAEAGFAADLVRRIDASGAAAVRINDLFTMRSPNTGD
jgi:hypothetical protein